MRDLSAVRYLKIPAKYEFYAARTPSATRMKRKSFASQSLMTPHGCREYTFFRRVNEPLICVNAVEGEGEGIIKCQRVSGVCFWIRSSSSRFYASLRSMYFFRLCFCNLHATCTVERAERLRHRAVIACRAFARDLRSSYQLHVARVSFSMKIAETLESFSMLLSCVRILKTGK